MSKPNGLTFQPAPRAQPRAVTPEVVEELTGATAGLGFSRPSSAPAAEQGLRPAAQPAREKATTKPKRPAPLAVNDAPLSSLKFDVPAELWTKLKIEAATRRVTVRYLVLEALSLQGYEVDLDAIPEDGRRQR